MVWSCCANGCGSEGRVASDVATSWCPDGRGSERPAGGNVRRGSLDGRGSEGLAAGDVVTSLDGRVPEELAAADVRTLRRLDRRGVEGPAPVIPAKIECQ